MVKTSGSETFAELARLRTEMKNLMVEKGKPAIVELFKELFEKHPNVRAARWTQYIPGFNDGDPCEFSVGEVSVQLEAPSAEDVEEDFDEDSFVDTYEIDDSSLTDDMDEISGVLSGNEDVLQTVFGNNAKVTITRDGEVEVDGDYDCGY